MANKENLDWLDQEGKDGYTKVDRQAIAGTIEAKAADFIDRVIAKATEYKLVNRGTLTSEEGYKTSLDTEGDMTTLEIFMIFYGLFQDRGVKGFLKQDNAPDSPYSFKSAKFSKEGIKNLQTMLQEGKAKISGKTAAKYTKIGLETKADDFAKKNPEAEEPFLKEAKQMAYFITAYGIKTRPFFKEAYEETFGQPMDYEMIEAAKRQWIATLKFLNKQK